MLPVSDVCRFSSSRARSNSARTRLSSLSVAAYSSSWGAFLEPEPRDCCHTESSQFSKSDEQDTRQRNTYLRLQFVEPALRSVQLFQQAMVL